MSEITKESRADRAIVCHNKGYNCAQSVAFAFLDKVDIDPETLFKVTEGLGLGMGGMEGTCGVFHLCAERAALFNMYQKSGQTKVKRIIAFRDKPPYGESSGMPCGACREFLLELNAENCHLEFMVDYESRKTITLGELMPRWWGEDRARQRENKGNE